MNAVWTIWLLSIVVTFAILETYAIRSGRKTLSRYTWDIAKAFPLLPFILGSLSGGLAVHFFWNWCPAVGFGNG